MLLAIDTGNTNTLFAVHDGKEWRAQWRIGHRHDQDGGRLRRLAVDQLMEHAGASALRQIDDCIISTVVPQSLFNQRNLARRYLKVEPFVVGENVELGVKVNIPKPAKSALTVSSTPSARMVPTRARPQIVIDSGTATTFDIVGADGSFEGGIIAPGSTCP